MIRLIINTTKYLNLISYLTNDQRDQGPVSPKPRKLFGPVKPSQNLEPYDYRTVLFTYSQYEEKHPSYKKFQAYTLLRF